MNRLLSAGMLVLALAGAAAAQSGMTCPATLGTKIPEGWSGQAATKDAAFERISVFNKDKDGQEYDLAPDDESRDGKRVVQTWKLSDYRDMPLLLRCHYQGTDAAIARELAPELKSCIFRYEPGPHGEVAGKPEARCE